MGKAGIALDDWKLPVFRRRLKKAGYAYEDGGAPAPNCTLLMVEYSDREALTAVIAECQAECALTGPPGGRR
jgi:hypothetical protein